MTKHERDVMKAKIDSMIESLPTSRDSGLVGKIAELQACYYCGVFRLKPNPAGKRDLYIYNGSRTRRYSIEIKTGGGELRTLAQDGTVTSTIEGNDFTAWCPRYDVEGSLDQLTVQVTEEFIETLESLNLARPKVGNGSEFHNKYTIQSYDPKKPTCGRNCHLWDVHSMGIPFTQFYAMVKAQ